jgi:hypothetical protein
MGKSILLAATALLLAGPAFAQNGGNDRPQQYYSIPQTPPPTQQRGYNSPGFQTYPNQAQVPQPGPSYQPDQTYGNGQSSQNPAYPADPSGAQRDPDDPNMNPRWLRERR